MLSKVSKPFYFALGSLSLALGFLGVFLPLLPTTPFLLLSAFCFSKSSKRMHQYLLNHKLFGPLIKDWQQHGVIRLKIKWIATLSMLLLVSYPIVFMTFAIELKITVMICICCVLGFIWTRPSRIKV